MKKICLSFIVFFALLSATTTLSIADTDLSTSTSDSIETTETNNIEESSTSEVILEEDVIELTDSIENNGVSEKLYLPDEIHQSAMNGLYLRSNMQINFIDNIAFDAKSLAKKNGLYASVMIAQAILESDWGRSDLGKSPNNNLFGIKGRYNGQYVLYDTLEWDQKKGKFIKVKAEFKKYPSQGTSLIDNADKLRNGVSWDPHYYSGTWIENTKSYKDATKALTGTYATDPEYNKKLNQIIEQYQLIQYDSNYNISVNPYSKDVSIKTNTNNDIYSMPFEANTVIGNAMNYRGTQVHLSQKMSNGSRTFYFVDGIGWMADDTFTNSLDIVTKSNFKRLAHVRSDKRYSFYKEPYNTIGAYRLGATTSIFFNQDVELIEKAINTRTQETFYLVREQGWVPSNAFDLIYDQEDIKNISKQLSIKPNATGSVFSKPYYYAGFEVDSLVKEYRGKQVELSQEANTRNGVYYLANDIGWIHVNAFTTSLDNSSKKDVSFFAKVNSNKTYNFYKEPYNTLGSERTGKNTKPLFNQDVNIIQEAIIDRTNEKLYLAEDHGWITSAALILYPREELKNISKDVSIKPNAVGSIFSRPYTYYRFEKKELVKRYRGKQVHLSQEAKTKNGIYYLADDIGWIHISSFTTDLDIINKKKLERHGKVKNNKIYNFYKEPYNTLGSERTGKNTKPLFNQDVDIIEEAIVKRTKEKLYLIKDYGWLTASALTLYPDQNIKIISKDLTIKPNAVGNIFSKPYTYYGFEIVEQAKKHRGKQVHLSQEASTKNGVYYFADGIGWIHIGALTANLDIVTKTTINRDARVYNKTYSFYSEPFNTMGSQRNGKTTNSIKGKDVTVTQKALSKQTKKVYYLVKDFGWIDQQALLILDVPNYEKINIKETILPNVKYNVHTKPYPYKGFKVIGDTYSMKMNNKTFTIKKQAHTSNGIYYEIPKYGWVNKQAFSSDLEKYKQVQNLLDRKYRSGNYGIYVKSLKSNVSAGVFQDTRYTAASTGKLPAIYYTQKRFNNGSLNPNTKYLYTDAINQMNESYGRGGAGILQNKPFGGMYTIDTILNWTIYYSDNQGANFLGYYAANKFSNPIKQEISQIIGRQWDTPFSITARENGKLMEAIYKQGGSANKYLQNTSFDNQRIPKYLPVKVGHKIGDVFDYRHDVAIIYAKEPYILSIMSKNYQSYESISILSSEIYNILK